MELPRRDFLRYAACAAAVAALGPVPATAETVNGMPYRTFGRTGQNVSLLGVGGAHIGRDTLTDAEAIRLMRHAVDEGVNFFDNAWDYHEGQSETRMGKALKDGYRDKVFLMTKTIDRTADGARKQLEESLRRLRVDHVDLWQIHSIKSPEDARNAYEKGVLDVAVQARKEGKVRFIGFTGHVQPEGHLAMIRHGFEWDSVQMPLNIFDHHFHSFALQVIPRAQEKKMAVIAMKTLGGDAQILGPGHITAEEALHYSMNLPVATLVSGMDTIETLTQNLAIAKRFKPLSEDELAELLNRTAPAAQDGKFEYYKQPANPA